MFQRISTVTAFTGAARERATKALRERHVIVHVVDGKPADVLARFSAVVDLLVLGSRGHGPVLSLPFGSTSSGA